ncbi:MAG: hypothetical protein KAI29_23630, partial [Cyclobacteriaceae bacterium]|nr:hypothetical protein [Cyclobacteriaceae bacterium]
MKKILLIIVVGTISGIGGSWFYQNHISTALTESQSVKIPVVNREISDINNVAGTIVNEESEISGLDIHNSSSTHRPADFKQASKTATMSVVYIKTISQNRYGSTWMDWFFDGGVGQSISSGSGVIYSRNGYIITNNHVVSDA